MFVGSRTPAASTYHLTFWGVTALALALITATGRSALLLRRRPAASSRRRTIATAAWTLAGALPLLIAVPVMSRMGPGHLMNWVPDAFAALRVTRALRATRDRRAAR
ncbi:hypothetical protein [Spirillospora sp. NPDC029432]|uniref:hypothetical protein n=1 Tax=Spirillospora sp. NPDC029432 TaxID=3154599 RepID=UPI0034511AFD